MVLLQTYITTEKTKECNFRIYQVAEEIKVNKKVRTPQLV